MLKLPIYLDHNATSTLRPEVEQESWRKREPIKAYAERLIAEGVIEQSDWDAVDAEEVAGIDAAVAFGKESPFPDPEEALDHLFAAAPEGDAR